MTPRATLDSAAAHSKRGAGDRFPTSGFICCGCARLGLLGIADLAGFSVRGDLLEGAAADLCCAPAVHHPPRGASICRSPEAFNRHPAAKLASVNPSVMTEAPTESRFEVPAAARYRRKAEACRQLAEEAVGPLDKEAWLRLAIDWVKLAQEVEACAQTDSSPSIKAA